MRSRSGSRRGTQARTSNSTIRMIRPAGARLKTMGGKASGPEPLRSLLAFARERILKRQGRRLRTIDAHDIICKIGECVVAGGVRRTAMISLSDLDDVEMRDAKKGQFYLTDPHRSMANNSAVYEVKPSNAELMDEWVALMKSGSGERGIFNRGSLEKTMPKRRFKFLEKKYGGMTNGLHRPGGHQSVRRDNPADPSSSAISPRSSRAHDDTEKTLCCARPSSPRSSAPTNRRSPNSATFPKTGRRIARRSACSAFRSPASGTAPAVRDPKTYAQDARRCAIKTNADICEALRRQPLELHHLREALGHRLADIRLLFGHPPAPLAVLHPPRPHHRDRLALQDDARPGRAGSSRSGADRRGGATPTSSNSRSRRRAAPYFKNDLSAIEQLEYWKMVKLNFTEHNPSATISVGEEEWVAVVEWLYENWDIVGGLSFLPRENHVYRWRRTKRSTRRRYEELASTFPADRLLQARTSTSAPTRPNRQKNSPAPAARARSCKAEKRKTPDDPRREFFDAAGSGL